MPESWSHSVENSEQKWRLEKIEQEVAIQERQQEQLVIREELPATNPSNKFPHKSLAIVQHSHRPAQPLRLYVIQRSLWSLEVLRESQFKSIRTSQWDSYWQI